VRVFVCVCLCVCVCVCVCARLRVARVCAACSLCRCVALLHVQQRAQTAEAYGVARWSSVGPPGAPCVLPRPCCVLPRPACNARAHARAHAHAGAAAARQPRAARPDGWRAHQQAAGPGGRLGLAPRGHQCVRARLAQAWRRRSHATVIASAAGALGARTRPHSTA
jgi:hypothetical protein